MQRTQIWPAFEELQAQLEAWQREHPQIMQLQTLGQSAQGRPLYAARLTDPEADDTDKEHVLLTATHSGVERSATTGVFYLMDWLLSEDPLARKILRKQVLVCMPVVNPDGYVQGSHGNTAGKDPYTAWTLDGPADPPNMPEAVALQQLFDQYQPEVHADYHGLDLSFPGYIMVENSGASYSNAALRPYHHRIMRLMDEAALAEGYPSDQLEQDAERLYWGPELAPISEKLWTGRPRPYAAIYCYNRYHTLVLASEVAWERSGFLRHRRLLQIGNEVWPGEHYPGYPTRVIMRNEFHLVAAYGETAAERRRSRVELWNKQTQIVHGMNNPQTEGLVFYLCATSPAAAQTWFADPSIKGFVAKIGEHPQIRPGWIRRQVINLPDGPGQWGDRAQLYLEGGGARPEEHAPIEHGLALRLRVPYAKARIKGLHLNGHPVAPSPRDGYTLWRDQGFTCLQINIPPTRSRTEDLFVITCEYDPGVKRSQGWTPGG
jgi:hypothetical protein